jgi:prepilin-type N-terminal cleavage/methylation domain-containing protein
MGAGSIASPPVQRQDRMFEIMRSLRNRTDSRARKGLLGDSRGFTLIEGLIVLVIGTILTVMAIPSITATVRNYRISGSISSITWSIHSTRYQALMQGYPYQVVFSSSANTYQIQNMQPPAVAYSNVGAAVPFSSWPVTLSADTTLNFKPNGYVTATTGALNFTITYQGLCQKLTVTNYGNVTITPTNPQPTCP